VGAKQFASAISGMITLDAEWPALIVAVAERWLQGRAIIETVFWPSRAGDDQSFVLRSQRISM
jgi:hypothetical protein